MWSGIAKFFRFIWRGLKMVSSGISVLVPVLVLAYLVGAVVIGMKAAQPKPVPQVAALLVKPEGTLVENRTPREPFEAFLMGDSGEVLLPALIKSIEFAADDPRITALVFQLEDLAGPTVSQALELKVAIDYFKASGKPVVAMGDFFDQGHYLLAAQADEVVLHPEGAINLVGFGVYRSYVRQLLDNARVTMNIFRVGENKDAVEPYIRDDMSDGQREVVGRWLGELWRQYVQVVEEGRGLDAGELQQFIETFPDQLEAAGGDVPNLMREVGIVDALMAYDERDAWLAELVGDVDDDGQFVSVDFMSYLLTSLDEESKAEDAAGGAAKPIIAVVPVEGELIPGESLQGFAGADTVIEQLQTAADDEDVAAIVLRINSPGGSVFASEVIRQKILEIKAGGMPIVVSMAGVAASGGYAIAADAEEIWAHPSTITGSIGVFAAFPTVERLYEWAGITVDGVGTTPLTASVRFDTGVDETGRRVINSMIANVYNDFVGLVANGREMTWDQVDALAGGKVWIGTDAQEIGLVDKLGGLKSAIASAAEYAGVEDYNPRRFGTPISPEQQVFERLGSEFGSAQVGLSNVLARISAGLRPTLRAIDSLRDPGNIYTRCLECGEGGY